MSIGALVYMEYQRAVHPSSYLKTPANYKLFCFFQRPNDTIHMYRKMSTHAAFTINCTHRDETPLNMP